MENVIDPKKYIILVVDDELSLRDSIVFDLKRKGFTALTAGNGVEAFNITQLNKVDLIISDIRMPGGDGIQLLEQIRKLHSSLPAIVLMTGFADISEEECIAKGAQAVIVKPFERKYFMTTVLGLLPINGGNE